jgi:hypothetical protein
MKRQLTFVATVVVLFSCVFSTNAFADPHCNQCPYDCTDLGLGRKDCSELPRAGGLCCVDLTKFGLKLAEEHDRVNTGSKTSSTRETCPPGFSPSEQKCSNEERRRGCKDMRLPGGLGCVRR